METLPKPQEFQNQSPDSHSSSSCSSNKNSGLHHYPTPPTTPTPTTPPPQLPITRSEPNNPYPTTFVQADPSSFKQVVQMLTGSSPTSGRAEPVRNSIKTGPSKKEKSSSSKLYERRNSMKNFKISPLGPTGFINKSSGFSGSPREILSPSILDFPSLVLSPVTPLIPDPFNRVGTEKKLDLEAEDKAIAKKGFFLHPSPGNTPRESEPRLLPLFPVTSPRGSSNNSHS